MAMALPDRLLPLTSLIIILLSLCHSAIATLKSVPELEAAMYKAVDGTACVRLLTLSGEIGCGNPGRAKVVAPVVKFSTANDDLDQKAAIVLPYSELSTFLNRTHSDHSFSKKVAGLLVELTADFAINAQDTWGLSDDDKFPLANFAPYANKSYVWNSLGSGILRQGYDFPVYLLSEDSTSMIQEIAIEHQQDFKYPIKVAELDMVMQTTKLGTITSDACLQEWSCLPLGGYSVWSSLPPINTSVSLEKQIVLAVASMDAASFFRDKTVGADSPLSGMIALLVAVDALSKVFNSETWEKQLIVAIFTGEAWGYLGSRRFLSELANGGSSVQGLNSSLIYQILEVGSVGLAVENSFYAHSQDSIATQEVLDAIQSAASSLSVENSTQITVKSASKTNPGVPPSSLMSFLHENMSVAGMVLTEYDTAFLNKYFYSSLDDAGDINISSIVTAASLVARTLYLLVTNSSSVSELTSISVDNSLVEELVGCLLTCEPGMSCSLVKTFITPTQICSNHYVGVFLGDPSAEPALQIIDDTSRFIWNFLANRTAVAADKSRGDVSSECSTTCSDAKQVCVGSTIDHKGTCVFSTTRYVPAYSTRLQYGTNGWRVVPAASGDVMGEVDPVYTESYWKTLGVRVYAKESSTFNLLVFVMGLLLTVGSFFAILSTKAVFRKRLKRA